MKINKITTGFVIQTYDTELNQWTAQEFVAGGQTDYEEANTGQILDPGKIWAGSDEPYLPCLMHQPGQSTERKEKPMQTARTIRETVHGNPGEQRVLPANIIIAVVPATNLPPDSPIQFWAHPVDGHPWSAETANWAQDAGVGLHADDVAFMD
jgi:hypothetical protein